MRVLNWFQLQLLGRTPPARSTMPAVDVVLITGICLVAAFGVLMVYSASIALGDNPHYPNYSHYHFVLRHSVFLMAGAVLASMAAALPMRIWEKLTPIIFTVALISLILVLVPGIGRNVKGAWRWIPLGVINFQPSELMKFAMILFSASYVVRKKDSISQFMRGFLPIVIVVGVVAVLLALEPDLGAFAVTAGIAMGVVFLGGIALRWVIGMVGLAGGAIALLIWLAPWRRKRLFGYLDPWDAENVQGSAYQLSHSLIAFGRGEWTGVGLGSSLEKLHYLPEPHTDFIVAVVGEELGFIGVSLLVLAFAFIVWRAFTIARQALILERLFNAMVAYGVGIWLGAQVFINIGVTLGLLPTKGLTLPLISYGGSATVMSLISLALLLRIDYENRRLMRGVRQ